MIDQIRTWNHDQESFPRIISNMLKRKKPQEKGTERNSFEEYYLPQEKRDFMKDLHMLDYFQGLKGFGLNGGYGKREYGRPMVKTKEKYLEKLHGFGISRAIWEKVC